MPLHLDYRPDSFDEMIGNEQTIKAISKKIKGDDCPHVFLITGPSGGGKTTLSRIIARELKALIDDEEPLSSQNYKELDAAAFKSKGAETINSIRQTMRLAPIGNAECRLWLLDEVHSLNKDQQDRLLKALEDTPDHVYFVLATTDPQKLSITLKRRCIHYKLEELSDEDIIEYLQTIIESEEKEVLEETLEYIASESMGSIGIALSMLDSIIDLDKEDMEESLKKMESSKQAAIDLCRALIGNGKWISIAKILNGLKELDPEQIRRAVFAYCGSVLLKNDNPKAYLVMDSFQKPFYDMPFQQLILACYEATQN